jgi:hypothetical protein
VYVNSAWGGLAADIDPDGSGPATAIGYDAFATLQQAIDAVAAGGIVEVAAGTYADSIVLNKSLTVQGAASATTILAGTGAGIGIAIGGGTVTLSGLTVRGYAVGLLAGAATHSLTLADVHLTGNAFGGSVAAVGNVTVRGDASNETFFVSNVRLARGNDNPLDYAGAGNLTVDGAGGSNRLEVFLTDNDPADVLWLNGAGIARDTARFHLWYISTGGNLAGGLDIVLGSGNYTVVVQGQRAGTPTRVFATGGNVTFDVAVTATSAYSGLLLDGGGAGTVNVFDQSNGAAVQIVPQDGGQGHIDAAYLAGSSRIDYQNIAGENSEVDAELAFLRSVYHQDLGRDPFAQDLAYWLPVLEASGQQVVLDGVARSSEAQQRPG